jgi:hypothetical protein
MGVRLGVVALTEAGKGKRKTKPMRKAFSTLLLLLVGGLAAQSVKAATPVQVAGFFVYKIYDNAGFGATAASLTTLETTYTNLTATRTLVFTSADTPAWEYGDNYGSVDEGWILAPETGAYTFHIASDDMSQLFLSTDDTLAKIGTDPICQITTWDNHLDWAGAAGGPDTNPQTGNLSVPITLTAGHKYYYQCFHVEGGGGDGVSLGWELPSSPGTISVIPGSNLVVTVNADNSTVNITQQPATVTGVDGKTVTYSVAATGASDLGNTVLFQWQKNGQDIPGAIKSSYTTPVLSVADTGTKFKVNVTVPGKTVASTEVTLTVVPDTFPPVIVGVGAIKNSNNNFDVGVEFDEALDKTSASLQSNYTLSGGTISGLTFYPKSPGVTLAVSGLTAGNTYTLTVQNVADVKGNKITSISKTFTVGKMAWGVVGADSLKLGNGVVAVGDTGFDIYSDGSGEWNNYDESTFVYEQITGNFDKVLRVQFQDTSSEWARAGLIARDVTNFGVDAAAQTGDPSGTLSNSGTAPFTGNAGRYQKIHVNPTYCLPPSSGGTTNGNNSWEGNRRLVTGGPSSTALTGVNSQPQYPNAWVRLTRDGQTFTIWRSDDGNAWTWLGSTTWYDDSAAATPTGLLPMPNTVYVGPEYSPENLNIFDATTQAEWLAQFRDYGDFKGTTSADKVNARRGFLVGGAAYTANGGGHSGKTGDFAVDLTSASGLNAVYIPDASFVNAAATNDEMSFSIWVKKYDIANGSAFWAVSPSSSGTTRGWQAHTPWSDDTIYFDTAGCCDTGTQRISANINTLADYTTVGNDGWWTNWHHFVFTKKADQKNIYIDGQLFLNGSSTSPLPTDFTVLWLGYDVGDAVAMHGQVDDFAVFGTELTAANVTALAKGTSSPKDLTSAKLLAYWDFNDASAAPPTGVTLSVARTASGISITFGGTLQTADTITGPWTDLTGASPMSVTPSGAMKFYRAKQ